VTPPTAVAAQPTDATAVTRAGGVTTTSASGVPALFFNGVSKIFPDGTGLAPIDLTVHKGEFISVLGPSGCGKSTLLRCVAGLETPHTGVIMMNGKEVYRARSSRTGTPVNIPPARSGLSMVFQDLALWPHMTVAENVAFPLTIRTAGRPRVPAKQREERTRAALESVGLSAKADQHPARLSGGQQQRVAIARAIISEPDLLLMDEPLSALDASLRDQIRLEITDLVRRLGLTVLYVTHDQEEALAMADRVLVLHEGKVAQFDTPAEVYKTPADAFVADFVGTMNRLNHCPDYPAGVAVRPQQVEVTAPFPAGRVAETTTETASRTVAGVVSAVVNTCRYIGGRYELRCDVDAAPRPWLVYSQDPHDAGEHVLLHLA